MMPSRSLGLVSVLIVAGSALGACAPSAPSEETPGTTNPSRTGGAPGPAGTGGAAPAATGGVSGTGGGPAGTGGSPVTSGTGGSTVGTGGASAGTGGSSAPDTGGPAPADTGPPSAGDFAFMGDFITMKDAMGDFLCHQKAATASGGNKSPALMWSGLPADTKSIVVSLKDNNGGTHWVMCNIPVGTAGIPGDINAAMKPAGAIMSNNYYGPGAGTVNEYQYRVWAMKVDKLPACGKGVYPAMLMANSIAFKELLVRGNRGGDCRRGR